MTYGYDIGDGAHGVDQQIQLDWARGYQVVDAAGGSNLVSDGGTANLTIEAAAGDINVGGSTVTCAQETVDLSGVVDPDDPRKVTVYRDASGTLNYEAGVAEPAQPSGAVRRDAYRPAPPTLSGTDAVILATVWVGAGATSIGSADIRDRRMPADLSVASLDSGSVSAEEATTSTSYTDPSGTQHTGELADIGDVFSGSHGDLSGVTSDQHHAQDHDNADHTEAFVSDGDGTERQVWVIANGASDPAGADPEDIIFEEES